MHKWRLGVCSALALLATVCMPVSASANTITENFTIFGTPTLTTGDPRSPVVFSTVTGQFDPSLGTLNSIILSLPFGSLSPNLSWTVNSFFPGPAELDTNFLVAGLPFVTQMFFSISTGTFLETVGFSGPFLVSGSFSPFEGTDPFGVVVSLVLTDRAPNDSVFIAAANGIIPGAFPGQITYDFTPTPLPAALPLFATSLGGLGLLGWRRKRKAVT